MKRCASSVAVVWSEVGSEGREREEATPTAGTVRVHKNTVFNLLCQLVHKSTNKENVLQYTPDKSLSFPFSRLKCTNTQHQNKGHKGHMFGSVPVLQA